MFLRLYLLTILLVCSTHAIQIKPSYGPPSSQQLTHREYGVPQRMSFREYGPPALKHGPPKLNGVGGGGSSSKLHEQIKNHYGAPKPFYGPPHKIQQHYGPPSQLYGSPSKPFGTYGPPKQNLHHKPAPSYSPPKPQFGPLPTQTLPLLQPAGQFKLPHQPATSYGPPPSGPLNIPPQQIFEQPPSNYGPPPLPNFNHKPETTVILGGGQHSHNHHQQLQQQQQHQVQIQVDGSGNTHSVTGSQAPFHTTCDGWKPIPAPVGSYIESNHIDTQSGYSQVAQSQAQSHSFAAPSFSTTQYSGSAGFGSGTGIGASGLGSSVLGSSSGTRGDELTDEQLVAVALQSSNFDSDKVEKHSGFPSTGPAGHSNKHGFNSIEAEAFQLSLGSIHDSYGKPPADSYAPGSKYSYESNQQSTSHGSSHGNFGINVPGGSFEHPSPGNGKYGPPLPAHVNYGPPPPPPSNNYGALAPTNGIFGPPPPPPPSGSYGPPPPQHVAPGAALFANHHVQAGLGIQYGKQSGNLGPFPPHGGSQPTKPVAYRPHVPQGLFESIGATVQHLDKFGVKPQLQAPTYIPPAANEIPQASNGNLNVGYGAPHQHQPQQIPLNIIEQQLPHQGPQKNIIHIGKQQQQNSHQQQQFGNAHAEYGAPPPLLPLGQQRVPQSHYLSPPPPAQLQQQYLPPTGPGQQQFNSGPSYSSSATASFDNSAFESTQYKHAQKNQPHFHDCANSFNYQQQQQQQHQQHQQQHSSSSGAFISQSIPIAEEHTQFVTGPDTSYGPPPSGGNELDHMGYASDKSQVTAFPDGTNAEGLIGLDSLNVLSAQKSEAIHYSSQEIKNDNTYQAQYSENGQQTVNHEEILSADLLQTILNAVEQPQQQHQLLPANHKAESRNDIDIQEDRIKTEDNNELDLIVQETKKVEVKVQPDDENSWETIADIQEIMPIVVKEENEAKH